MEKEITLQTVTFEEMIAPDGRYLTQSAEVADGQRLYFTRRPLLAEESISDWRIAEAEEREAWAKRQENITM